MSEQIYTQGALKASNSIGFIIMRCIREAREAKLPQTTVEERAEIIDREAVTPAVKPWRDAVEEIIKAGNRMAEFEFTGVDKPDDTGLSANERWAVAIRNAKELVKK